MNGAANIIQRNDSRKGGGVVSFIMAYYRAKNTNEGKNIV